jgi:SAM-dependent methyltransferase
VVEGKTSRRVLLVATHMLLRPRDALRWLGAFVPRKPALELGLPWMSWRAIGHLENELEPGLRVFEWGAGGSTVFFAERDCHVVSVETDPNWASAVLSILKSRGCSGNVSSRCLPIDEGDLDAISDYLGVVHNGEPWDVIVVDGPENSILSRVDCVREAAHALKPGGMLVLDDAYRPAYAQVPQVLSGWTRLRFRGLGPARLGVTQTDVYYSPTQDASS